MVNHHRQHGRHQGPAQDAASAVLEHEVVRLLEHCFVATPVATPVAAASSSGARQTVACAACKRRVPRDDPALFTCSACKKLWHWTCAGLGAAPDPVLPQPVCCTCLKAQGRSGAACALAQLGRLMAEAYVAKLGYTVSCMDPDGWCLVACVTTAAPALGDTVLRLAHTGRHVVGRAA